MDNFYIIVNEAFLATVDLKSQQKLKEIINQDINSVGGDTDSRRCYIRLCPYCNAFGVLNCRKFENDDSAPCGLFEIGDSDSTFPNTCVFCGETAPYHKIKQSVKKCQILYDLYKNCSSTDLAPKNNQNERILLEQCIVVLATGIELFLKDTYVLSMDLKDILGQKTIDTLTLLMSMRNVIVHNNGTIDLIFRNNLSKEVWEKYPIATPISITGNDIIEFINTINIVLQKIDAEFDKIIVPEILKRIETNLQKF